jgi:2-polyprenyl-3-methyl-5-hydroxy-6-metoxy-1,4-benzoquinol methylase
MKTREDMILEWAKGPNVLDVGCTDHIVREDSVYWLHQNLRQRFPHVVGIDISEENLERMRALGYENLYRMDAEQFSLAEKYDTIVAGELIEHLSNPGLFLDRVLMHLKPGGRLIITTPYVFSLLYIVYSNLKYPKTCENAEHTHWLCVETMRKLAARHGFRELFFELVMDYRLDNPSWKYVAFARIMILSRHMIHKRLRNNVMFFVFEPA